MCCQPKHMPYIGRVSPACTYHFDICMDRRCIAKHARVSVVWPLGLHLHMPCDGLTLSCVLCLTDALQAIRDCQSTEMINDYVKVEMDFDMQTDSTLWKLYDFTEQTAQTVRSPTHFRALC